MDPQKLIKSVSETPLEEWKKEHFMRFVNNPRVNLASLSQIINQTKKNDANVFFDIRRSEVERITPSIIENYDYWRKELLSFSTQNYPKYELNIIDFSNIEIFVIPLMGFSKMEKILNKLLLSNQQLYLNNITSKKRYKIEKNPSSWIGVDFSIPQNNEKEKELSKKHSEIRYEANKGFYLKDNDSKNGTYIFAAKQKEIEILEGMNIEISDKIYKISLFKNKEEIHLLVNDSLKYSIPMIKNGRTKLNEEDCEIYENNGKFVFISNQKGCWIKLLKEQERLIEDGMLFKLTKKLIFKASFSGEE